MMNRRAVLGSAICGVSALCGCTALPGQSRPPRVYEENWVYAGDTRITTLSATAATTLPSVQTLLYERADARETLRAVDPFVRLARRYRQLDYTDRFVGVTGLRLPANKTVTTVESSLENQTYTVTLTLTTQDHPDDGNHWKYLLETWLLNATTQPERTELAVTD